MIHSGTWARNIELLCFQLVFKIKVLVISNSEEGLFDTFPYSSGWGSTNVPMPVMQNLVVIYFHNYNEPWNTQYSLFNHYAYLKQSSAVKFPNPYEGGQYFVTPSTQTTTISTTKTRQKLYKINYIKKEKTIKQKNEYNKAYYKKRKLPRKKRKIEIVPRKKRKKKLLQGK